MWLFLKENVIAPTARRLGTNAGTLFAAYGASSEVVSSAAIVVTWVVLASVDLGFSYAQRRNLVDQTTTRMRRALWERSL